MHNVLHAYADPLCWAARELLQSSGDRPSFYDAKRGSLKEHVDSCLSSEHIMRLMTLKQTKISRDRQTAKASNQIHAHMSIYQPLNCMHMLTATFDIKDM